MPTQMKLSLITPTGSRPEAFALCELSIQNQTQDWHEWVVVDDCLPATPSLLPTTIIRPETKWRPGQNTHTRNLDLALAQADGDVIFIIEDDDYYAPTYLQKMVGALTQGFDAVGESRAKYYHLPSRRYRQLSNAEHASLCQTAITRDALPILRQAMATGNPFFDIVFWDLMKAYFPQKCFLFEASTACVGMKGLPGRPGIGMGHNPPENWETDPELKILNQWLGEDAERYKQFIK